MELTIKEYDERLEYSQKNRSKVRKDLVKQDIDSDTCTDRFTPLYRWQTVYLRADYKLTHTEVCVYAHIYGTKYCYETTERISENTACSVKGVRTAVESLIKKGLIFAETDTIVVNGIPRKQRVLSVNTEIAEKYEKSSMKHKRGSVGYNLLPHKAVKRKTNRYIDNIPYHEPTEEDILLRRYHEAMMGLLPEERTPYEEWKQQYLTKV